MAHVANSINQASDLAKHMLLVRSHVVIPFVWWPCQDKEHAYHYMSDALSVLQSRSYTTGDEFWRACIISHMIAISLQTKASSNYPSAMCDAPDGTIQLCSPYEKANPTKDSRHNTLIAWWTSQTAITGTLQRLVVQALSFCVPLAFVVTMALAMQDALTSIHLCMLG